MYDWRKNDPVFAKAVQVARASHLTDMVGHITDAAPRDWKAASYLLEHAPETREEFSKVDASNRPVQVILHINRGNGDDTDEPRTIEMPVCKNASEEGGENSE